MEFEALHPECHGHGCVDCTDGYIKVTLAKGALLTKVCGKGCMPSGGRIVGPDLPPPPARPEPCPWCEGPRDWLIAGTVGLDRG